MLSIDVKLKEIMKSPEAMAIFDKYVPGAASTPALKMGAGMSLRRLQTLAPDKIKAEILDDLDRELRALGD